MTESFQDVVRPKQLTEEYPHLFKTNQLKELIRNRHENGLNEAGAVLMVSNKAYLVREKFVEWFMNQTV